MQELRPLCHKLIVNDDLRLRKETSEAMHEAELLGALTGVIPAAGTPAVEEGSISVQLDDVLNDRGNRNALAPRTTDQRVININVDTELVGHR